MYEIQILDEVNGTDVRHKYTDRRKAQIIFHRLRTYHWQKEVVFNDLAKNICIAFSMAGSRKHTLCEDLRPAHSGNRRK